MVEGTGSEQKVMAMQWTKHSAAELPAMDVVVTCSTLPESRMDGAKRCPVTDLRRREAAATLMKPCRPLLSSDLWQCCWTATLLATAERHALNPLRSRAPLHCKAAACGTQAHGEHHVLQAT